MRRWVWKFLAHPWHRHSINSVSPKLSEQADHDAGSQPVLCGRVHSTGLCPLSQDQPSVLHLLSRLLPVDPCEQQPPHHPQPPGLEPPHAHQWEGTGCSDTGCVCGDAVWEGGDRVDGAQWSRAWTLVPRRPGWDTWFHQWLDMWIFASHLITLRFVSLLYREAEMLKWDNRWNMLSTELGM